MESFQKKPKEKKLRRVAKRRWRLKENELREMIEEERQKPEIKDGVMGVERRRTRPEERSANEAASVLCLWISSERESEAVLLSPAFPEQQHAGK
jgi:hypothetical protein